MNDNFSFTYSLKERQEIEEIRKKYTVDDADSKTKSPADKIKQIDKNIETATTIISIAVGIAATLIFGVGLTLCLKDLVYTSGIIIGTVGLIGMSTTPIVHKYLLKLRRSRASKKILKLIDEYLEMTK